MSKQSKGKANLPAGSFVPLGHEGYSSSSDSSSNKSKSHFGATKRELPHSHVCSLKRPKLDFLSRAGGAPSTSAVRRFQPDETKWRKFCCEKGFVVIALCSVLAMSISNSSIASSVAPCGIMILEY
ncbi:hypothetical protein AB6A40_006528 [Gnathostoma spinigerum]|uniref:Uncharacterized protein n=1 Tax=Gnathostoma spinigerum TaxID=75299 RepID=A0ABD6ERB3_9BILA